MLRCDQRLLTTLLVLGSLACTGCAQVRQFANRVNPAAREEVETKLMLARAHESEGDTQQSERLYREVLALDSENGKACHRLGIVLMTQGQTDEGILYLEQANLLLPDNAKVLADLGYAYLSSGSVDQALPLLQAAYEKDPRDERTINNLAQALGYSGEYGRSLALFREIMSEAEATANLAYIHSQTGDGAKAMELYSRALDLDPGLRSAANALVQLGEMRNAFESEQSASVQWASRQTAEPGVTRDYTENIELTGGQEWTAARGER
jgi:tetratricopeptide (TPR) repeat protein